MSKIFVDQVDPKTATTLTLGTTGDTVDIPTGVGLSVTDEVKTNKISPATGTAFALGDSGDTFTVPSGATIVNSGTATGFGGDNTPSFGVRLSGNQLIAPDTATKVEFDTEDWDTNNAFDSSTNYRFTVPADEGGKYQFVCALAQEYGGALNDYGMVDLYVNGAASKQTRWMVYGDMSIIATELISTVISLSATDYVEAFNYHTRSGGGEVITAGNFTYFTGWKLIGV